MIRGLSLELVSTTYGLLTIAEKLLRRSHLHDALVEWARRRLQVEMMKGGEVMLQWPEKVH